MSIWNQARGFLLLRSLRSLVTHKAPIKVNQCIKCPCESSLGDLNIMQQLAQETKDTIASYLHSKSDLASLTMVDRAFASAGRRARFRTVHISESSPSPSLICSYDTKCLHNRWYLGTAVSAGNAICEKFPEIGRNVRRIVFFATYLKIEDVVALMRLLSKAPFVREFVFVDTDFHFFKDAFGALLSSMERVSALAFKGCSISTQSLDTITRGTLITRAYAEL